MKKIKNGFFITVEGIDGSGKTSIVNFLSTELSNLDFNVIKTREPGGTALGAALREIIIAGAPGSIGSAQLPGQNQAQASMRNTMLNPLAIDSAELDCRDQMGRMALDMKAEFLLFAADRAQHIYSLINPALSQGAIVVSDRGSDSSLAYQGYGKGLDLDMIKGINKWIMENSKPDLVIYLKIDYKKAIDRVIARGEKISSFEKKGQAFFDNVINGFNEIFRLRSQESPTSVLEIDATQSAEDVKKEVLDKVLKIISLKELI